MKPYLRVALLLGLLVAVGTLVMPRGRAQVSNPTPDCELCFVCRNQTGSNAPELQVNGKAVAAGETHTANPDSNGQIKFHFTWEPNGEHTGPNEC